MYQKNTFIVSLVLSGSIALAMPVQAAILEEIIVTAQKREQALSDVGIAVTAFTGKQIDSLGFETSTDIIAMSPGVYISADTGGQNRKFTIRGVTQNDFLDAVEAPVAVYIDEGYVSTQQGQVFGVFDLERVEILKGPQGTLFGRNATGGLVHYVTRKPSFDETEGYAEVTYGSYDQVRFEGAFSGPLSDTLAARAAIMYNRHDGVLENEFPANPPFINTVLPLNPGPRDDLGNDNTWGGRLHFLFAPNEDVELLLSGYYSHSEVGSGAYEQGAIIAVLDDLNPFTARHINTLDSPPTESRETIGPGGVSVPIFGLDENPATEDNVRPVVPGTNIFGDLFGYRDLDLGDFVGNMDWAFDDINKYETYGVTGKLTWELTDAITLTSITDYKSYDKQVSLDVDAGPVSQFQFMADSQTETIAEEIRLNGVTDKTTWVAGFYLLHINNDTLQALPFLGDSALRFASPPFGLSPGGGAPGPGVDNTTVVTLDTKSYSIFGQVDYALSDALTLTAGLRVIIEDKDYDFAQIAFVNNNEMRLDTDPTGSVGFTQPFGANPFSDESSDTLWTGKIQLDWKPNDDWLIYGGINRGVKAGSFNGPLPDTSNIPAEDLVYEEEVLLSYEIGFKATLFEGTTRLNGSAYYYDYKDYQAFTFSNVSGVVSNNDSTFKGIELDLTTSPIDGLDMMFGLSYIDAEVEALEIANGIFRDVEPTFTPDFQFSGLVRYAWPTFAGELAVQMDANYAGSRWANLRNFDAHIIDSNIVANAAYFGTVMTVNGRHRCS